MIDVSEKDGAVTFSVRVVPRASKTEIVGEHDGALKVRIAAPPVEGAANEELIKFFAKTFGVAKSSVEIVSGEQGRNKTVRIYGGGLQKGFGALSRLIRNAEFGIRMRRYT